MVMVVVGVIVIVISGGRTMKGDGRVERLRCGTRYSGHMSRQERLCDGQNVVLVIR